MKSKKPLPKGAAKRVSTKKPKTTVARKKPVLPLSKPKVKPAAKPVATQEKTLTPKQQRFIDEYLIDLNATQAAIRSGYSEKTANEQGARLLANVSVKTAIQKAMDKRSVKTGITAERVLLELGRIAFFDIRTVYNEKGELKPMSELSDDAAAALVSIEALEEFDGTGKDRKFIGLTKKVKVADKVASLQLAMRHLKMLTDKGEISGPNGGPVETTVKAEISHSYTTNKMQAFKQGGVPTTG